MKILIVEDDMLIAEHLKEIILEQELDEIQMATSADKAFQLLQEEDFDLVLMDINMERPEAGIELAKELKEKYKIPFMFITAQSDKRIVDKAVALLPQAYIVKPFIGVSVLATINIVRNQLDNQNLIIRDGYKDLIIPKRQIIYGKASDNYIELFSARKKWVIRATMGNVLEMLDSSSFLQVHRSYFVNTQFVDAVQTGKLSLNEGSIAVPVSKAFETIVRSTWKKMM